MTSTSEQTTSSAAKAAEDEGKHVAGVAKGEAREVAGEAKQQARGVLDDARTQVNQQSQVQRDRLVKTMNSFADDLQEMAARVGGSGMAAELANEISQRTRSLTNQLDGREPGELLDRARDFARRRPGMFLLGATAAGVVAGRLARGAKEATSQQHQASTPRSATAGTMAGPSTTSGYGGQIGGTTSVGAAEPLTGTPDPTTGAMPTSPATPGTGPTTGTAMP